MRIVTRYVGSGIKGDSGIRRMGSEITSLGSGITDHGIGLAVFLGIRLYHIFVGSGTQIGHAFGIRIRNLHTKIR